MYRPKVELHLHLDGSVRPETALSFINADKDNNYDIDEVTNMLTVSGKDNSLADYLRKFDLPVNLLQTRNRLVRVSYELVEDLAAENTIYAEIRVAPIQHLKGILSPTEVVEGILEGIRKATKKYDIKIGLLLCAMRHLPQAENDFLINLAEKYKEMGVVGIDLAGDESVYPASNFDSFFKKAKERNIPFTIHAGEAKGPDSIQEAIELGATRIGHGIRAYESEKIMDLILDRDICLECCPISNRDTNAIKDFSNYPILHYLNRGIAVTLNSDNRTVSNTNFDKEVEFLRKYLPLTEIDIKKLNINAVKHSFTTDQIKSELLMKLNKES